MGFDSDESEHERARRAALILLQRFATDPLSWQTLERDFRHHIREYGFVGYVDTGRAWVAAGPPVAPPDRIADLARDFVRTARARNRRAIFFGAPPDLIAEIGGRALRIGLRPGWNPLHWTLEGKDRASLRYQLARARKRGVTVRSVEAEELTDPNGPLRGQVDALAAAWLDRHAMAPMGFVVSLELYVFPEFHRYFAAEKNGEVVGFLSAVPVFSRGGWFAEDLLRSDDAPNGTTEMLVDAFFRDAGARGVAYATLGLVPLAGPVPRPLRFFRVLSRPLFDFAGLAHFKEKLRPDDHEIRYVGGSSGIGPSRALLDTLTAFSRVGLIRFGLHTLGRGSLAVVGALTLLLLFWLPLLAAAPVNPWFPSATVKGAWVSFDLLLAMGLIQLCRRYRHRLAVFLAGIVTLDALVTSYEAFVFNVPRIANGIDALVVTGACVGPIAGAAALWSVVRRQGRRRCRRAGRRSRFNK